MKRSDFVAEGIEWVDKDDSKPLPSVKEQPEVATKKLARREEYSDAEDFSQKGKKKKSPEKQVMATESEDEEDDGAFKMKTAAQKKAEKKERDSRRKEEKRLKTKQREEKQEYKDEELSAKPPADRKAAVAEEEQKEGHDEQEEGEEPMGQMEEPRKRRREGEEEAAENKDKIDKRGKNKSKNKGRRARDAMQAEATLKLLESQRSVVSSKDSVPKKPVYGDKKKKMAATHTAPQPVTGKTPEFVKTEPLPNESAPSDTDTKTPAPSSLTLDMPACLGDAPLNTALTMSVTTVTDILNAPPASRECTPTLPSTPKLKFNPLPPLWGSEEDGTSTTEHNDSPVTKRDVVAQDRDVPMPLTQEKPAVNKQYKGKQWQPLNQDISASMNKSEGQREEPRKIISLNDNVQLNKSEKAWKLSHKKEEEVEDNDRDEAKTEDLFKRVRGVLNKLTPEKFESLMAQVTELQKTIDTVERLKGVINLIFEKAISESKYSEIYARMCFCHSKLKVPTTDKPGDSVTFQHLLLNRCQKEFEKDKDDEEIFEKTQKELDAAVPGKEKQRLKEKLEESKDKAKRRSLGNTKFIGELFKLKMLTEGIVHDCIIKLLKNHDEKSLECLCRLLEATGKDLDSETAKARMNKYFKQMENIQKESKAMIRCKLQDVFDLRGNNWVPRREIQGPKTIDLIHKDAKMEEHREVMKVQQAFISNKESIGGSGGRTNSHTQSWLNVPQVKSLGLGPVGKTPSPSSLTLDMPYTLGDALLNTTPTLPPSTTVTYILKPPPAPRECTPTLPSTPKLPDYTAAPLPDPVPPLWGSEEDRTSMNKHNDSSITTPDVVAQERDVPTPMPLTQEKPAVNKYQCKEQCQPLNQDISASINKPEGQREEPRKITPTISLTDDAQLNKSEKAWTPSRKKQEEVKENDPDEVKTQDLFKRVRGVLNKLTPEKFDSLMDQLTELHRTIDTEERLKGVIDLIFEKAISESKYSETYAKMCFRHSKFKVPTTDKPGDSVTFQRLLVNRCQKEFEKDKDDEEIFEKKQKELDAVPGEEEKQHLKEKLEESKDKAKRCSLGNIKFIGELFKLKMLTEGIVYDCIIKLLKNHDEKSLECLCRLFETTGEGLDSEKAKERMDKYFKEMENIQKESKAAMIRCKLQDVLDLRGNNWVPRRVIQGPKTIDRIHEEHKAELKVQQSITINKELNGGSAVRTHTQSRLNVPQDKSWNPIVPISTKNGPIDTLRLSKITKAPVLDFNDLRLGPGGKSRSAFTSCWAKGCNGWTSVSGSVG